MPSRLRQPYGRPRHVIESFPKQNPPAPSPRVSVQHPGYGSLNNLLFVFAARDGPDGNQADYILVHTACAIVANNMFDGWLSTSQLAEHPRVEPVDGLIPAGTYYFHVSPPSGQETPYVYPIVPSFRNWRFPHDRMPDTWRNCQYQRHKHDTAPLSTCRLTLSSHPRTLQRSHVIPSSEKLWFGHNQMSRYGTVEGRSGQDVGDMAGNLICLRTDLHHLWDSSIITLVPKQFRTGSELTQWAVHALTENEEILELYHNVPLHACDVPVELLLARFALDIFPQMLNFLAASIPRWLVVPTDGELATRLFSPSECRQLFPNQGRGRSFSPSKRQREEEALDGAD